MHLYAFAYIDIQDRVEAMFRGHQHRFAARDPRLQPSWQALSSFTKVCNACACLFGRVYVGRACSARL